MKNGAESSKLLIMVRSSGDKSLFKSPPRVSSLEQRCSDHSGNSKSFRNTERGTFLNTSHPAVGDAVPHRWYCLPEGFPSTWEFQRYQAIPCQPEWRGLFKIWLQKSLEVAQDFGKPWKYSVCYPWKKIYILYFLFYFQKGRWHVGTKLKVLEQYIAK
jgi:hypothetical protein